MASFIKVFLAFAAYAAIHSLLLTEAARGAGEMALGSRAFRGLFRLGFSVQAVVLLIPVVLYAAALPDRELFHVTGSPAWFLWAVRLAALGFIFYCVARFGATEFLGFKQFRAWRRGEAIPGDGVETGELVVGGPYEWIRHPMYSAGFLALWAEPHWTWNYGAFALAASLYLWLGSLHEERRLVKFYGESYRRYMDRTPRYVPWPRGNR